MNHKYSYTGFFILPDQFQRVITKLGNPRLDKVITYPHITVIYRPDQVDTSLFGSKASIKVTGYGINETNEGLQVEIYPEAPVLQNICNNIKVPHVTLSISNTGRAVNTCNLIFEPIEPFELSAVFGGLTFDKELHISEDESYI